MEIRYFGWSSIVICCSDTAVGFDLFGDQVTPDAIGNATTAVLCVTHGHPDHAAGARRLLSTTQAYRHLPDTHLVSSAPVVKCVMGGSSHACCTPHSIHDREAVTINDARLTAFCWVHAPLLPPGLGPKLAYGACLLGHPIDVARIAHTAAGLPIGAPLLGFHVAFPCGLTLLNYAEGLHRLTDPREVEAIVSELPAQVALFAVEPDDVGVIPRWVELLRSPHIILYEAHRPWRERFGLPKVDLRACASRLSAQFPHRIFDALALPGQAVRVTGG